MTNREKLLALLEPYGIDADGWAEGLADQIEEIYTSRRSE